MASSIEALGWRKSFWLAPDALYSIVDFIFVVACTGIWISNGLRFWAITRQGSKFSNVVAILSAILCVANFAADIIILTGPDAVNLQEIIFFLIRGLSWLIVALTVRVRLLVSTAILLSVWGLEVLLGSAFSVIEDGGNEELLLNRILSYSTIPVSLLLLISIKVQWMGTESHGNCGNLNEHLLNGQSEDSSHGCLLANAGFFARACFTWMNPLLKLGYKKPLDLHDVPKLCEEDKAETTYRKFLQAGKAEKEEDAEDDSIFRILIRCHWKDAAWTAVCAFLKTVTISCSPLVLRFFIDFVAGIQHFKEEGYVLVACLFFAKIIECFSQRHWYFGTRRIGLRIRSSLIAAIYEKELKLSHEARQRHSGGEITSYISVDTYRLGEFPWWLHQIWTVPLQITIALCILISSVGWATLPGFVIIVITALIQTPLAQAQQIRQSNFMVAQDQRLRTTMEILSSMKIVKLQAWEGMFKQMIIRAREIEFKWLTGVKYIWAYGSLMFWMSPIFTASVVFGACIPMGITLNATVIFTVLAAFRVIQEPVRNVPDVLTAIIQARVSLSRLQRFFRDDELEKNTNDWHLWSNSLSEYSVEIEDGVCSWDSSGASPALYNINLRIKQGELVAVCGSVGSGKSTLLHAILGETRKLSGSLKVRGSIAYASQTAWIQSGTVKDNILFGYPMDQIRYEEALKACALEEDLKSFSHGDVTEIGERGLNLSGGQKQRIQLARALYSNADIYLLDDPFSALDAQTGASLFKTYILGALSKKTIILVTHQVEFLTPADTILVMEGGKIADAGSYHQLLLKEGNIFEKLVNAHEDAMVHVGDNDSNNLGDENHRISSFKFQKQLSILEKNQLTQLTQEEEKETGNFGLQPYFDYVNISGGKWLIVCILIAQTTFVCGNILSNYWLATQVSNPATSDYLLIGVFAAISALSTGIVYGRARLIVRFGLRASQAFFAGFVESLFHAPMAFFDSTPLGRILSRTSSDMNMLDMDLPTALGFVIAASFDLAGMLIIIATVTWQILLIAVPLLGIVKWVQGYYLSSARELIRINGTTKAPIVNKTGETVNGAVTIRAFRKQEEFKRENMKLINADAAASLHTFAASEWISMRVEILGTFVLASAALLMVVLPKGTIPPGSAGLSLSYSFSLNGCQVFLVQWVSNITGYVISVERIKQYLHLPREAPAVIDENRPPASWPHKGKVELQNLQIRYREKSPLVLKGISCIFPGGKRVGLVGRTGSGKTTLITALFRLVEPCGGRILIDDVDICSIGLFDLRSRLGVIPQEPFLFRGTVRSNLDPLLLYSDNQIWESLRKCQLLNALKGSSKGLDTLVSDEGENWSAGQRQLFCLARVLLKRSRVLVLDEATSSIDSTTDSILQKVIREEFSECSVITVAHRIPTVVDSDMILGLRNGYMVEYDTPQRLLQKKESLFSKLVAEYWSSCAQDSQIPFPV